MHECLLYTIDHQSAATQPANRPVSLTNIEVADRELIDELEKELTLAVESSSVVARPSRVGHGVVVAVLARTRESKQSKKATAPVW